MPKGNLVNFLKEIINIVKGFSNRQLVLIGDFNIDFKNENISKTINDWLWSEGFDNVITDYTRIMVNSQALLDVAFTINEYKTST